MAFGDGNAGAYDLWAAAVCLSFVSMTTSSVLETAPMDNRIAVFESFATALYYYDTSNTLKNRGAASRVTNIPDRNISGYDKDFVLGALGQRSDDADGNWCAPNFKVESTDLADDVTLKAETGFNHKTKCTW